MRKLILATAALLVSAAPAMAAEIGIAFGGSQTSSSSNVLAATQGSSASAIFGVTQQSSLAGAESGGEAASIISGNDSATASHHLAVTEQTGTSSSFGLAGSQNSGFAVGTGSSNATNGLVFVSLFAQP
jgi:hypothetical protein